MRVSKESLNLKVVVRRVATGSAPFAWELHRGDAMTPLRISTERFRSMEAAYKAGQVELQDYTVPSPSVRSGLSRRRRVAAALITADFADDEDFSEALDEEDFTEIDAPDQSARNTGASAASNGG